MNRVYQFKEEVESDNSEDFLRGLGFKDPFHRELLSTDATDHEAPPLKSVENHQIKQDRMNYPLK